MSEVITKNLDLWTSALFEKADGGRGGNGRLEVYGIKKLRELILGSALRGLFENENESLPESIEQDIANAKDAYYKSIGKKSREYAFGPPLLAEFKLPASWKWKRVGDLCDLQTGATPSTNKPEYFGGDIRWLVSGDINQRVIEDCEGRITQSGLENSNCKVLPPKTVLIALNGQGKTRASVALLKVPAACNQSLVGMIPFDATILDPMFLLLSLKYRYFEIRDITGQDQRRGLNMGLVAELSVPLPPLAEQRRIVAKVDELMALCDQLEQQQTHSIEAHQTLVETLLATLTRAASPQELTEAWTRIAKNFDTVLTTEHSIVRLKQTILQLAVMGNLVRQDPNDEPASELSKRIVEEKAQLVEAGEIKKQKPLPGIDEAERPFELPMGWVWCRLQEIVYLLGDGLHGTPEYTPNERYYFVNGNNLSDGEILIKPETKTVARDQYDKYKKPLGENSVLVSINGTLGNVAFNNNEEIILGKSACFFNLAEEINKRFIKVVIDAPSFTDYAYRNATGTTIKNLGLNAMNSLPIALPPKEEQHRIVAKVDELMALCDGLKARIADAQTTQIHLADAIVEQTVS